MKRLFSVMLVVALLATLFVGCGTANNQTPSADSKAAETKAESAKAAGGVEKQLHFVYVSPLIAHPIWLIAKDGFDQACKELNIKGSWVGPQNISPEDMTKLVETAVAEKADAIITQGLVPATPLKTVEDAKIPLLVVDSDIPDAKRIAYIGKSFDVQAKLLVDSMEKKLGKDKKLVIGVMVAAFNYAVAQQQIDALEKVLKQHPGGYQVVNKAECKADKLKATVEWQNALKANPDINVCVNFSAGAGAAAAKVVQEMNIANKVTVYDVDDIQETLDSVKSGAVEGTVVTSFYNYGYQATYWLYQNITQGKKPAQISNDPGTILVTKENVDKYNDELKKKVDLE